MRNLKAAEVREVESTSLDEQIDRAVQMTAACNEVLDWIESILPGGDARLPAASMLKKEKHALWFEHPSDLAKGFQGSGMVQSVHVLTIESNRRSGNGSDSAVSCSM